MPWLEHLEDRRLLTATVEKIDVNTNPWPGSFPSSFIEFNDSVRFLANAFEGTRLYTTDGTDAGTVPLYSGNSLLGAYSNLVSIDGTMFFGGGTGDQVELWKSDGTEAGTIVVKDIRPGASEDGTVIYSSYPSGLTDFDGLLVFAADDGVGGTELWKSNGTADGTLRIKDINPDANGSNPTSLVNY